MLEASIAALVGSIVPTAAVIIISIRAGKQIHKLDVKVNGRLSELLKDAETIGELKGQATEQEAERERRRE